MTLNSIIALILHYFTEFDSFRGWLRHNVEDSDVTIIESKIKMEFFWKSNWINRFFGWYFFDFDSRLYWRRQRTAASSKHDSWAVAKSAEYADLIILIRIACRGGRAVWSPRLLQGVPCIIDPISPLPFLYVTGAGDRVHLISTILHPRVL